MGKVVWILACFLTTVFPGREIKQVSEQMSDTELSKT